MSPSGEAPRAEAELVAKARLGDAQAFTALVEQHAERLHAFIHRLCGDSELAVDLTQETFLRAWRGIRGFDGQSAFYTWLYRIGRNTVISAARARAARPVVSASIGTEAGEVAEPAVASDPSQALEQAERVALVLAALQQLPFEFREIIVLRDVEDRSYEEIAAVLEIPAGTVRSRLFRARERLRETLGGRGA